MRITVEVHPGAKHNKIVKKADILVLYTSAIAENGKANQAAIKMLSDYFSVAKSNITIVFGKTAREKIVDIN